MKKSGSGTTADDSVVNQWVSRPWSSWLFRALAVLGPFAAAVAAAALISAHAPEPDTVTMAIVRWIGIALTSTVVLVAADRVFRRLLPLATLFKLTLSFPDKAPSRFRMALRTGTTRQLRQRIDDARAGRVGDTPSEAAELVLELVAALSIHDRLTRGHSERVRAYTQMIGEQMGLSGVELDRLRWAGLLHDIGKLLVPTEILNKDGRLTDEEFDTIKMHPEYGRDLIAPLTPWLGEAARAVWEHHERWDGGGYPHGIAGSDIAKSARIVSVADTFDVITSVRSYKKAMPARDARAELARCAGTQFDPAVVRAFLNVSLFPIGRVTGPSAWLAQLSFFPAGVFSSAATGALVMTVAAGASAAALGSPPNEQLKRTNESTVPTVEFDRSDSTDSADDGSISFDTRQPTSSDSPPTSALASSTSAPPNGTVPTIGSVPTTPPSKVSTTTDPDQVPTTLPISGPTSLPISIPTTLPVTVPTLPISVPTTVPVTIPSVTTTLPTISTTLPPLPTTLPSVPVTTTIPGGLL